MPTIQDYWSTVLSVLKQDLSPVSYDTWISNLKPIKITDQTFVCETCDDIHQDILSKRYKIVIEQALKYATEKELEFIVTLPNSKQEYSSVKINTITEPSVSPTNINSSQTNLIDRYVFDNFVVGNGNKIAHAAAIAVAEAPGKIYNPLFLYGGVGLGKTHLMHSIAHYILDTNPAARVLYTSCEKFTNELISAIRNQTTQEFKNKYRNIDVLLIDDIQFISQKESTQEELFHTFNDLWTANKQIIISSDCPPREIKTLEDRLRSRFEWGIITDIQPPDFETRTAILEKKAELDGTDLPKEVFQFIAKTIVSNIRELEGALTNVIAYAKLTNMEVTVDLAEKAIKDLIDKRKKRTLNIETIQEFISEQYNIKVEDMKSSKRNHSIAYPRHIAVYLCTVLLDESLVNIGKEFGNRDHSTTINSRNKIISDMEKNAELKKKIDEFISRLKTN